MVIRYYEYYRNVNAKKPCRFTRNPVVTVRLRLTHPIDGVTLLRPGAQAPDKARLAVETEIMGMTTVAVVTSDESKAQSA
jgi:hypothetical protein